MTRPTKEAVDDALAVCDRDCLSASAYPVILADEVRALREEADLDFRTHVVMVETLTAERDRLREELAHAHDAAVGNEAELRELREEVDRLRDAEALHNFAQSRAQLGRSNILQATLARVEALCHMQHEDSAVSIGDIRAALKGEP